MSEIEKRKRGRPKEGDSNRKQYRLRMSEDMTVRLNNLSQMTGKSRADIFREAFNIYENLEKMKLDDSNSDEYYDDFDEDFDEDFE